MQFSPAFLQLCPAGMVLSKLGVSGMIDAPPEEKRDWHTGSP
jgi:hypothetical protein